MDEFGEEKGRIPIVYNLPRFCIRAMYTSRPGGSASIALDLLTAALTGNARVGR